MSGGRSGAQRSGGPAPYLFGAASLLLAAAAVQAFALHRGLVRSRRLLAVARPFEHHPAEPTARVLLVGDSIGVGVGAGSAAATLPALLATAYPRAEVHNRCRSGARVADVLAQLRAHGPERVDLVLVFAGGNDVLHATPAAALAQDCRRLLDEAARIARHTVWLGNANVGGSPLLAGPLRWWFTWRSRRTVRLIAAEVQRHGATFVDFFRPPADDPIARRAGIYFAGDGLHPSAVSHRLCFDTLRRQAALDTMLDPPLAQEPEPWPPSPTS